MDQPLLTVIVPCYNVEKYVDKCILSIVNQKYSNLEIQLIDDCSTDNTGKMCDEWQERDSRIRVIHKPQNEGLPYARKTGIEHATGEYVAFVDSDDWIDVNMYADMMVVLLTTDSDIADSDLCFVYEDGSMKHRVEERDGTFITMDRIESVLNILENPWSRTSFGTKVFKRKLFNHIEFPKRQKSEDFIVQYLFHQASKTALLNSEYYYYYQRSGSISKPEDISEKMKNLGYHIDAYYDRYLFVKQHPEYHSAMPTVKKYTIRYGLRLLHDMIKHQQHFNKEQFQIKVEQLCSINFSRKDNLPRGEKIDMYLLKISPNLFRLLRSLYYKISNIFHFKK